MYIRKSRGPKTEPHRTPYKTVSLLLEFNTVVTILSRLLLNILLISEKELLCTLIGLPMVGVMEKLCKDYKIGNEEDSS